MPPRLRDNWQLPEESSINLDAQSLSGIQGSLQSSVDAVSQINQVTIVESERAPHVPARRLSRSDFNWCHFAQVLC